jgi:hypothetical protein
MSSFTAFLLVYVALLPALFARDIHYPELVATPPSVEALPMRNLFEVVTEWNPHTADMPEVFHEGLQHFNYGNPYERKIAEDYRNAEVPFKLYNVSELDLTAGKWTNEYLLDATHKGGYHVERSDNANFMWWR